MNLPNEFTSYMHKLLGDEYNAYIDSYNKKSFHGLRVNRLKINVNDFLKIIPFKVDKIPFIDNGFIYDDSLNPSKDSYYHAGLYYLQEPSAMLPANRLPIQEGDKVLDLCAAPGGKATELAGKLNGSGLLYANDISASRALALLKNLELTGASNIYVTAENPDNLANKLPLFFDKILCDVPCSGEGMFRKDSSLINSWLDKGPDYYQPVQRSIVDAAYKMLKPGGMLMYSTCTFNEKEDEDNIIYLLDKYDDLSLMDIDGYEGFSKGIKGLEKCVRVFPHKMDGEGHFLALLKKAENENSINLSADNRKRICDPVIIRQVKDRSSDQYNSSNKNNYSGSKSKSKNKNIIGRNRNNRDYNKTQPDNKTNDNTEIIEYRLPALEDNGYREGIRYLRTGLLLNDSQAYAMTLSADTYSPCFNFNHDDLRVTKYLKGETIFIEDEQINKGLTLISVNGYPLGFAKNDGSGKLKNLYNKGWRLN